MKALLHQQMGWTSRSSCRWLLSSADCSTAISVLMCSARNLLEHAIRPLAISGHSAHVGQEVEVYYRWHPYFGRRLRCENSEERANGRIIHLVVVPGHVITALAWMVDPVVARQWAWAPRAYRLPRCLSFTCS
ncbi:hypothetical protein NKI94_29395 [Mesorhizobium australicum]|uniref:hypothetical protein n=1 Tax=Mesorhizobium australicum TaxID=536018 RepID=UPI0033385255